MVTLSKDLRGKFGMVRDQGVRPTCLAFATSDLHAASRAAPFAPLSAEFLYFHAVQRSTPPNPTAGVTLSAIQTTLQVDGQPIEADWPYLASLPIPLSAWASPSGVVVFREMLLGQPKSIDEVVKAVEKDHPVLLCLKISEAFHAPGADGLVSCDKTDPDTGYHAVIAVAVGAIGSERMILIRNSWGEDWGLAGHGWLSANYVSDRLHSMSIIK